MTPLHEFYALDTQNAQNKLKRALYHYCEVTRETRIVRFSGTLYFQGFRHCFEQGSFQKFPELDEFDEWVRDSYMKLVFCYYKLTDEMKTDFLKGKGFCDSENKRWLIREIKNGLAKTKPPTWNIDIGITQRYKHPGLRYLANHLGFLQHPNRLKAEIQRIEAWISMGDDDFPPEMYSAPAEFAPKENFVFLESFRLRKNQLVKKAFQVNNFEKEGSLLKQGEIADLAKAETLISEVAWCLFWVLKRSQGLTKKSSTLEYYQDLEAKLQRLSNHQSPNLKPPPPRIFS
jgi:hypothetical protein